MLSELARRRSVSVVDLDDPALRAAVRADPTTFVGDRSPVCIDEYQRVPAVLDAIKAELNRELRPGRAARTPCRADRRGAERRKGCGGDGPRPYDRCQLRQAPRSRLSNPAPSAWGTTLRGRAANAPKVHVVDSGLAARLLRLTPEKLARRDLASLSQFGHLLETFAVGELLRQASWLEDAATCGHWRT